MKEAIDTLRIIMGVINGAASSADDVFERIIHAIEDKRDLTDEDLEEIRTRRKEALAQWDAALAHAAEAKKG